MKTTTASVSQPSAMNVAVTGITHISCNGASNGAINITPTGGSTPYSFSWSNNAITEDISGVAAGTYTVTVTDVSSCSYITSATVNQPTVLAATVANQVNVSCNGGSNGAIDLAVSGGTSPFTYLWSNGSTVQDPTGLSAGTYSVTVTGTGGCTTTTSATISGPSAISISSVITKVSCNGGNNGSASLTVNGGTSPYSYSWSNAKTTENLDSISAGTYIVTVTDAKGCVKNASASVTQPPVLTATIVNTTNANCQIDANGSIDLSVTGGTTPYAYVWSNGAMVEDPGSLSSGTYHVTVTDTAGCKANASAAITQPPSHTVSIVNQKNITCFGGNDGNIDITVTGGTPPFTYNWSNGAATQDISGLPAGTYNVAVGSGSGCVKNLTVVISQPAQLALSAIEANILCNGATTGSVNLTVSGGVSPFSYAWSNGATTKNIASVAAGTYIVTVKDANNCAVSDTSVISEPSGLTVSDVVTSAICGSGNGAVNITVSGGIAPYAYVWSNAATSEDISNVAAGNYTVTVTDGNNCKKMHTASVTQPGTLSAAVTKNDITCNGSSNGSISITPSGGTAPYAFNWSNGAASQNIVSLPAGNYTVTVSDNSGCSYITSASIMEPAALSSNTSVTHAGCYGGANGSISLAVSGGVSPYSFSWSNSATTKDLANLSAGQYHVTITDANGCTSQNNAMVNQPAQLSASILSQINVSCFGGNNGSVNLGVSGGVTPYAYSWSSGASIEDPSSLTAGTYSVTVTSVGGCSAISTVSITQPVAVEVSIKTQTNIACSGGSNGALDINVSGGTAPYSYQWSNGAVSASLNSLQAGNYTVTVTDSKGCTGTLSTNITQGGNLNIISSVTNATCNGGGNGSASLTVTGGTTPYTYAWSNGAASASLSGLQAGNYSVTVTDATGCSGNHTVSVSQPVAVAVSVSSQQDVNCNGGNNGSASLTVNGGTAPYTYSWSNGAASASLSGLQAGNYSVTATDASGCTGTANVTITEPAALSASVASATDNSACGANNGAVDITVTGGVTPYLYSWSNGAVSEDISGLPAGTYIVFVTDANGCTDSVSSVISQPGTLSITLDSVTKISCNGGNDGAVDISVSGGTSPYSYLWSSGNSSEDLSSMGAGAYSLTVSDAAGCSEIKSYIIAQPDVLSSQITVGTAISCNGMNNGALNLSVSGGTSPYTYLWNTSAATEDISGLAAGNYSVTVTDAGNCISNAMFSLSEPGAFSASVISKTDVSCNGGDNGSITISLSGGTSPFTYNWSNSAQTQNLTSLSQGTYSVSITDAAGCPANTSETINQPDVIAISETISDITVNGGNDGAIDIAVNGGTSPYTYSWSNYATTEDIAGLPAGIYTVVISDAFSCMMTDTFTVNQPAATAYCSGTSTLTAVTDTFEDGSSANLYGTDADCYWLIQPANTDYIILSFLNFNTELNEDALTIYDGPDTSAPVLAVYSGNTLPYAIQSTGGTMLVHFASNGSENDSGWTAVYNSVPLPVTSCSGTTAFTAASGTFSDGSATNDYSAYSDCKWLIQPAGATSITLGFSAFATEQDYDVVTVYDGADTSATMLAVFSGSNVPDSITSSGGSLLVHFTSDYSVNSAGWDAFYSSSNTPNSFCSGTDTLTASSGSFGDGSGSANYGPNSDCQWLIQPAGVTNITLTFSNFSTESGYDSVVVYDGPTSADSILLTWWGDSLPAAVTSSSGSMLVRFLSDNSTQQQGWFASYTSGSGPQSPYCSGTTTLTAATGSFSDGSASADYVENSSCSWLIQPAGATYITLSFSSFATESGYDAVYVYDGTDTTGTLVAAYSGNDVPAPVTVVGGSMYVWFSSDYIVNAAGWDADYTSGTGAPSYCTGTVTLTADSGTFHDGSGTNNYLDNADCFWLIHPPGASSITLDFFSQKTEQDYDFVAVYDGTDTSAALLGYLTGDTIASFTSTGGNLLVWFYADNSNNDAGFEAHYTSVIPPPVYCSGTTNLTAVSDTFSDGSGANNYLDNTNCKWLIQPSGASHVTLHFLSLDIENSYDNVYVYDGADSLAPLLGAFTGSALPSSVSSTGSSLFVQFMSDYVSTSAGWEAYYDTSYAPPVVYCSGTTTLTAASGSFSDGSDSSDYLSNSDCQWLIQPAGATGITLSFSSFTTEEGYDVVTVYDGATLSDPVLATYSGSALPASVTSSGGNMLVHFTSDYSLNFAGWDAEYTSSTVVPCSITTSISGTDASCVGCADGVADLTVTGANGTLTYLWSTAETTEDIAGLIADTYYVTVTDTAACSATDSVIIGEYGGFCSGTVALADSSDCFSDGSGSSEYMANANCKWLIQPAGAQTITLTFSAFDTEAEYDSVTVYDGATVSDPLLGSFSGSTLPAAITSTGGVVLVVFESDGTVFGPGWDACYTSSYPCNLSVVASGTDVNCFGDNDGTASIAVTGGTSPFTYLWSNGTTAQNADSMIAGTYIVTVTDAASCTAVDTLVIGEPPALTVSSNATDATCNGCADGTASVSVNGGTTPYSYLWSHGAVSASLNSLTAGNYTVTITDNNGCAIEDTIIIGEPVACTLTTFISGTDATCNGCADGVADLSVTGANGTVTYLWSTAETTEDIGSLVADTYFVTVTDTAGCSAMDTVIIKEPAACTIATSITGTDATCNGCADGMADLSVTGANGTVTYLWSTAETTEDIGSLVADTYFVTVTDTAGCSATDTVVIGESGGYCSGTTMLTALSDCFSDGSGSNDYSVNSNCQWLIQPAGATNITLTFSAFATETGYDSVTVYDGATTSDPVLGSFSGSALPSAVTSTGGSMLVLFLSDITVTDAGWDACYTADTASTSCNITIAATGQSVSCNGGNDGSITLSVTGGTSPYSYNWSNGAVLSDLSNLTAGTYSVTVTDSALCTAADTVVIGEPTTLTASISGTDATCNGCSNGAANLEVTGGTTPYAYLWSNSATSEDLSSIGANTYSVTVTDAHGCTAVDTVAIAEPAAPYCSGTITLTAPSGNFSDGSGTNNYVENSDCQWLIQPTGATSIALSFSAFATESGYDSVTVYDGATTAAPVLGSFSGSTIPSAVNSTGGSMLVSFKSDILYNDAGWDASYTSSTDIAELSNEIHLSIYPNPSAGVFVYSLIAGRSADIDVKVVNVIGETIWRDEATLVNGAYARNVELDHLSSGVYFFHLSVNGKTHVRKILVE